MEIWRLFAIILSYFSTMLKTLIVLLISAIILLSSKTYDIISVKEEPINPKIFEIDATLIKSAP